MSPEQLPAITTALPLISGSGAMPKELRGGGGQGNKKKITVRRREASQRRSTTILFIATAKRRSEPLVRAVRPKPSPGVHRNRAPGGKAARYGPGAARQRVPLPVPVPTWRTGIRAPPQGGARRAGRCRRSRAPAADTGAAPHGPEPRRHPQGLPPTRGCTHPRGRAGARPDPHP